MRFFHKQNFVKWLMLISIFVCGAAGLFDATGEIYASQATTDRELTAIVGGVLLLAACISILLIIICRKKGVISKRKYIILLLDAILVGILALLILLFAGYNTLQTRNNETNSGGTKASNEAFIKHNFYYTELSDELKKQITGISYPQEVEEPAIAYEELRYVHVLHYDFMNMVQEGELICNQAIAEDLVEIFAELYLAEYPIEKVKLIDAYSGDDEASMENNNTSCFNYRVVSGTTKLSSHAYGLAIDINPLYNPYIRVSGDNMNIQPTNAGAYADRDAVFAHKIDHNDLCYQLFTEHGFTWGGDWTNTKDYQHFEKINIP